MLIVLPSITSIGLAVGGTPTGLAMTRLAATSKASATGATANLRRIVLPSPTKIPARQGANRSLRAKAVNRCAPQGAGHGSLRPRRTQDIKGKGLPRRRLLR